MCIRDRVPPANPNSILRRFMARIPSSLENHCGSEGVPAANVAPTYCGSCAEKTCSSRRRRPCVNHIYSVYILFQAMQKPRHLIGRSCGRKTSKTRCRCERIGKVRTDWICWTSSGVFTPVVEQSNVAAEAAIDCGHSLTRCIMQRAVYFPCGPMAGGNCHEEGLRPVERGKRCGDNLTGLSKRRRCE